MSAFYLTPKYTTLSTAVLCLALGLSHCSTSEGGQSGGGTNNETPLCNQLSRQSIEADVVAEGFSVAVADELALYVKDYAGELLDDNGDVVSAYVLELSAADDLALQVVRQEINEDSSTLESETYEVVDQDCADYYEAKLNYIFRLGSEDAPMIEISGTDTFRWSSARKFAASIHTAIEEVTGSFEPALIAEGYQNIELQLELSSTSSDAETLVPDMISGELGWQGEKFHGDPSDPADPNAIAEAKTEITGSFSQALE
ncbi:MAG: hypothetical protein IPJ88_17495 [Myxococcales bacterium]|nr:MAG: hypothetical protein IPJ88_17495 [Myxococcales bacterium]